MKYWSALIVNKQRRSTKSENGHGNNEKCVCNPILVTTFTEWFSGTEPWPRTHGAVRPSSSCLYCVCVHIFSFAGLIRRTPLPTFSDTAITDCHSDTTIFLLRAHFFMLNSVEHEILNAHKYKNKEIRHFLGSDKPKMLFSRSLMIKCQQLLAF